MTPVASLVIPTRNRCEILRECLLSAGRQTVPVEIIVLDDGSTDGTQDMLQREFPQVRYERFAGPSGPSLLRNRGSELANATILFPLDDDAVLVSPRTIEQTLREFDNPRVGAVAIPFINVQQPDAQEQQRTSDETENIVQICAAYVGAAHALRRDVFLSLGGYRTHLFYMGEESDYCIRMLNAGYVTKLGNADALHHHESTNRAYWRMDYYCRRNDVLFAWHNVPWPDFPLHFVGTIFNGLKTAITNARHPWRMVAGLLAGIGGCVHYFRHRKPVRRSVYKLDRNLKKRGPRSLDEINKELPPTILSSGG